jgi:hypothetical protein
MLLLDEIATSGAEVRGPGGKAVARNDRNIVLRAKNVIRVGSRSFVVVTIENLSKDTFDVTELRTWLSDGASEHEIHAEWRFHSTVVESGEEVRGTLLIPAKTKLSTKTRLRIRVEASDPARAVELGGIAVRP